MVLSLHNICLSSSEAFRVSSDLTPVMVDLDSIDPAENRRRMEAGELYHCFTPDLVDARRRCTAAFVEYNASSAAPRRKQVEILKRRANEAAQLCV
jgi:hypothetical protein